MKTPFAGFRFSIADAVILIAGGAGSWALHRAGVPLWWVVPMTVGHFFLFCNVFRVRHLYELWWAVIFMGNVMFWFFHLDFGWLPSALTQLPVTMALIREPDWTQAMDKLREHLAAGSITRDYARTLGLERGVSGYAFHTVPAALYGWLRHPGDFVAALTSVLDCGGDTDTTGAIVGGIAGAALGADAIPREWRDKLCEFPLSPAKLTAAAHALAEGRRVPSLIWPARLVRNFIVLAIVLAHGFRRLLPPY